jgi:hypothetical protein
LIAHEVKVQQTKLHDQVELQDELKQKVSHKSNELVDIKPGQTVEDIYVSLRRRGKVLKGQSSKDAPVLRAEQKVLLLPERSIRIMKEFLVDLKEKDDTDTVRLKEQNEELKELGNLHFTKIKEQHERDKVVGSPEENLAKEKLSEYEQFLTNSAIESNLLDGEVNILSSDYIKTIDTNVLFGKDQYHLLAIYLDIRRKLNKTLQVEKNLNQLKSGVVEIEAERIRQKQRSVESQLKIIFSLNQTINNLKSENSRLTITHSQQEQNLIDLENSFETFGIKGPEPKLEDDIHESYRTQCERRQFQDESEDVPSEWDKRLIAQVQDMGTELKNALTEYPSNKNFPKVKDDWINLTTEIRDTEYHNRVLERTKTAQTIRVSIIKDIEQEIERIKDKIKEGIDESSFEGLIKELRERLDELKIQLRTIYTDVKRDNLLVTKCRDHKDLSSENVQNCPECHDLLLLVQKVNHSQSILDEADRCNQKKIDVLKQKDERIGALKDQIEYEQSLITKKQIPRNDVQQLEFLMADQIEGSLVPISKLNEPGVYLFGTRKMYVKILERKLMIRVGGGYIDIDEYMVGYTDSELAKVQKLMKKENADRYESLDIYKDLVIKNGSYARDREPIFVALLNRLRLQA